MGYIVVNGKQGEAIFSNPIFNDNKKLEFTNCNLPFIKNETFVFDKEKSGLLINGTDEEILITISPEQVKELAKIEESIIKELSSLYKNIVTGEEKLICFDIGIESFPYLVTTKTILEAKVYSPKYIKALEYAFSDKCLEKAGIETLPNFKNYEDMQKRLGKAIINLGLKPNDVYNGEEVIKTTLREILKGVM